MQLIAATLLVFLTVSISYGDFSGIVGGSRVITITGEASFLHLQDSAKATLKNGARVSHLSASGAGEIVMQDGADVSHLTVSGRSKADISGGKVSSLRVEDEGVVHIRKITMLGGIFSAPGVSIGGGAITYSSNAAIHVYAADVVFVMGKLTGLWSTGERFAIWMVMQEGSRNSEKYQIPQSLPKQVVVHDLLGPNFDCTKASSRMEMTACGARAWATARAAISIPAPPPLDSVPISQIRTLRIEKGADREVCKAYKTAFEQTLLNPKANNMESALQQNRFLLPEVVDPSREYNGFVVYKTLGSAGGHVVLIGDTFGWRGTQTYVNYFSPDVRLEDRLNSTVPSESAEIRWHDVAGNDPILTNYQKTAIAQHALDGRDQLANMVWRYASDIFVFDPIYDLYERSTSVRKVERNGTLSVACIIAYEETTSFKAVIEANAEYQKALSPLMGQDTCGGTMHPISMAWSFASGQFKLVASNAPWRALYVDDYTRSSPTYGSDAGFSVQLSKLLSVFANGSIYDNKSAGRFMRSRTELIKALARYYQTDLGVHSNQATPLAEKVMLQLNRAAFHIGEYTYDSEFQEKISRFRISKLVREEDEIYEQLNAHLQKQITKQGQNSNEQERLSATEQYHAFAEALVLKPRLLRRYIAESGRVDSENFFNKTLLMSAAHHNQIESARILLQNGAIPDVLTKVEDQQCTAIHRDGRNALMYAAENADLELIALLEKATKNRCQQDRAKNFVPSYILANSRLSFQQKRRAYDTWYLTISRCPEFQKPTFDCAKADNMVDMVTCSGGSVTMWDESISRLYKQLGDSVSEETQKQRLRASQRDWVNGKKAACLEPVEHYGELQSCVWQYTFQRYMKLTEESERRMTRKQ